MSVSQCTEGCLDESAMQGEACKACLDLPCGQDYGCCVVRNCGAPESAFGIHCGGGTSGGADCADFCDKCATCYATEPSFNEGACRGDSATFDRTECTRFCGSTSFSSEVDGGSLPSGWRDLSCAALDSAI